MMENHMFGGAMGAGHWLWMLFVAVIVVIPGLAHLPACGLSGHFGSFDFDSARQSRLSLFLGVCGLA